MPKLPSELYQYIDSTGAKYLLTSPDTRVVESDEGTGMPPLEYITQRGPFQHGESVEDVFLRPRVVQLMIRHQYTCRNDYWSGRAALLAAINPIKGPGILRKILGNGRKYDLDVYIEEGPNFNPRGEGWDEWGYREALKFIAHNPIYYNPNAFSQSLFSKVENQMFPLTFPFTFLTHSATAVVNYTGTWEEYPTIAIAGPITNPIITNWTTGESIGLTYGIIAGEVVVFDLTYERKSVTSSLNGSLAGYISTSDLATFHLAPGVNNLSISGYGTTTATTVTMTWHERFIGI